MDANTVIWILLVVIFILSVFLGAAITCCRIYESKWKNSVQTTNCFADSSKPTMRSGKPAPGLMRK